LEVPEKNSGSPADILKKNAEFCRFVSSAAKIKVADLVQ
jgi:hypothetical protein